MIVNKRDPQAFSQQTLAKGSRLEGATVTESVCPYCAVGCGQLIYTKAGKVIDIEGNPRSPINQGTLCPKGASTFQLTQNPHRVKHVMYRAPYSDRWEQKPLQWALDRIAERIREAREEDYARQPPPTPGRPLGLQMVRNVGTLGGATLDNEENYLIKKLFTGGLGIVSVENQARI
jgi:formate dehydrogenase major subunit